ncbi:WD40/YVTN/BNR-like repeat-containing protein [Maribacter chungangensis]|uniref:WD40/YVTN/BNR-like repeat-containing protein n=1 Tax=Maribacter chungangensis TaxID=1069117 RepID=A0ABW3B3P9_9FLAO
MKYLLRPLVFLFSISAALAQNLDMKLMQDLKPRNIGPGGMSGRVTAIDVVLDNPEIIYVGTASGGLWKSNSGGIKWDPIFDNELTASIGAVAIQQSNPSVIWVGTGEGNPRNSLNGGYGIYRSLDGGKSWKAMGLEKTRHIHRIKIDPTDPNTIYVGAIGSPWGEHPERGVYKSTDGGETWKNILFVNNKTGVADMVMDPSNPNKLIVAMWEHKREPWFFTSGGKGSGLYMTHDGGKNWKQIMEEDGLPKGDLGRIGIAIAPGKPDIVYALVEAKKNALYKSEDGGFTWKMINNKSDIGNRPFYYSEIYVDPQNENRVYSVFTYVNVSEDGGKNFTELMPAYRVDNGVHPDHHAWWIHPENGQFMMDGNDGGMNITRDGGKSWRFVGNIPVAQFYHINVDHEFPYNVYGGMQDNGSWRGPAYVWRDQGIRNSYWQEISFGDGFDVVPDLDNSQFGYTMSQQGNVSRYDHITGNNYTVKPTPPDADTKLRFNWNAAIGQDPFDNSTAYFGSQFVHKTPDKGLTWSIISPDLTTNDPEKQKQSESGGLSMDATGAENHTTILVIEPSPVEKDMLWVGTDDGKVHYTQNGGKSWTEVTQNIKGLPAGSWIPQIKASNKNKGEALLLANDYRRFNYTPYAYRTKDYGKTWERIVDGNDVESYTLSIIEDLENPNLLFLGTDDGLYISFDGAANWQKWTEGYPTVSTKDLVIHPREHDLVIGTFGRAAWVLDDIRPLRALAADKSILEKDAKLFTPPTAYQAAYQQPTGSRFGADAMYNAENRKEGAMITYFLKEGKKKNGESNIGDKEDDSTEEANNDSGSRAAASSTKLTGVQKKDSIQFDFYDGERLIRTLKFKTPEKAGFHRIYWEMDEKGPDRPSRTIQKNKRESGGMDVKPGTYTIKMRYGTLTDETEITVKPDPRLPLNTTAINEVYETGKSIEKMTQTAADAVKQLVESKNVAEKYSKDLKALDEKKYKDQIKASKDMMKQVDSIIALYLGKVDKRQGITRNPEVTVMQRIRTANYYTNTRKTGITKTERDLIQYAEAELKEALEKTNSFFNTKWSGYTEDMEKLDSSPFKNIKMFTLK